MKAEVEKRISGITIFNLEGIRSGLCTGLALIYLLSSYLHWSVLDIVLNVICLFSIIICIPAVIGKTRILSLLLFISGALILAFDGANTGFWLNAVSQNANLVTLLILVPVFGLPLYYGGYYDVLDTMVARYMNNKNRVYWVPALLGHFFGALMNMGAIPVVYQLIIHGKFPRAFQPVPIAILRGFSSSIYWSPNMVSVAVVIHYLNVPWAEFARGGILLTVISLLVGWLIHVHYFNRLKVKDDEFALASTTNLKMDSGKLLELLFFCTLFLGTIIYVATRTTIPVLNFVPLLALVYPVFWLGILGKRHVITGAYRGYIKNTLPKFVSEIVMFLGAGFLAAALLATDSGDRMSVLLSEYVGFSPYLISLFIILSIVLISIIGVTPLVTVMTYSAALKPELIGLSPLALALMLVGGWATSVIVSPFSGVTLIMSGLTQKSTFEIAYSNWMFGLIMVLLLAALPLII